MSEVLLRAPSARVFERSASLFLVDPRGAVHRLDGDSAGLARAVLSILETAKTRDELFASLAELVGGPVEPVSVVDELLSLLKATGAVLAQRRDARPVATSEASRTRSGLRVVLCVTGAVQSVHTPWLVSLLLGEGHDVRVVMTRDARRFCRREGLEALTHNPVCVSLWDAGPYGVAPHIRLAEWAELVLVAPASATTIARIAAGSCEEPVSAVCVATRAPVVLAPSMNVAMVEAPAVRRNLEQLCEDGFIVVHPTSGHEVALAPTERAAMRGTMPAPVDFVALLRAIISTAPARRDASTDNAVAAGWDARYAPDAEPRPWESDALDEGAEAALDRAIASDPVADVRVARRGLRVLDLGCGTGTVARHLSSRGCAVTAIDIAASAVAHARAREGGERVRWIVGDALVATLDGRFDVVHDRALLHVLAPSEQRAYARRVTQWLADGGSLVLTAHDEGAPAELGTTRFDPRAVLDLFGDALVLDSVERASMRGPDGRAVSSRRYVLRKRAPR
ncbi:MAG: methyltransferase domain-containing protein [Myxococcales bacterium]|nr:methyltransferase domain-containing protein [Myxococcales bacterium]